MTKKNRLSFSSVSIEKGAEPKHPPRPAHAARGHPPRVLPKKTPFLMLAIASCGGARPPSNATNEASTTEDSDPITDRVPRRRRASRRGTSPRPAIRPAIRH